MPTMDGALVLDARTGRNSNVWALELKERIRTPGYMCIEKAIAEILGGREPSMCIEEQTLSPRMQFGLSPEYQYVH